MSRRSLRYLARVAPLAFALMAALAANDASAYCRMTTGGGAQVGDQACVEIGAPFFWNDTCLSYAVDGRGSTWMNLGEIEDSVNAAFEAWETADCGEGSKPNLVFKPSMQPSTCKRAEFNNVGNVNTIAFLDPWEDPCLDEEGDPYDPRAFAVTIVWHNTSTGEILDADMMINDQRFVPGPGGKAGGPYADCPESGCLGNDADLRGIVTHEAGHFIGIGHCNVEDINDPEDPCVVATMFASAERNAVDKRSLAPDDIDAVCEIYPPGSLDETCTAIPIGGLQLNCETTQSGNPITCDGPGAVSSSSGGCSCSTTQTPAGALWATFAALLGLSVTRRRSARRGARS